MRIVATPKPSAMPARPAFCNQSKGRMKAPQPTSDPMASAKTHEGFRLDRRVWTACVDCVRGALVAVMGLSFWSMGGLAGGSGGQCNTVLGLGDEPSSFSAGVIPTKITRPRWFNRSCVCWMS